MKGFVRDAVNAVRAWFVTVFYHPDVALLRQILKQQEVLMASVADIQAALATVNETIVAERLEVQGKLTDLSNQVKALQDQIAAGGGITPAELDSVLASINSIQASIADISEPQA